MVAAGAAGAAGAAAAAGAARRAALRMEEEEMTGYGPGQLDGWEFKILRSPFGAFKSDEAIARACDQEQANGWELVEVFDQTRLRFKRQVEERSLDVRRHTEVPVYRTQYSGSGGGAGVAIVLLVALATAGVVAAFMLTAL